METSGELHVTRIRGPAPQVSIERKDRYLSSLDDRVQAVVNSKFAELKEIVSKASAFKKFNNAPIYDENGDPIQTKVDIALEDGCIFLAKGERKAVVYLKDLDLTIANFTKAEKLLAEMGGQIGQKNGFEISTWNRLKSMPLAHIASPANPASSSICPSELHIQAKKDIMLCTTSSEAKRYMQIMRYGAVMMHEHAAGLKLLKLRYEGEVAHIGGSKPKDVANKNKMKEKIGKIEAKIKEIQNLDGYAFSKMARFAAKLNDPAVITDEDRKRIGTDCRAEIKREMEVTSRPLANYFRKTTDVSSEARAYARAVGANLLTEDLRGSKDGMDRSLVAVLCLDPALSWVANSDKSCLAPLPQGVYSDLGEECEAFMYDIHASATAIAHLAATDIGDTLHFEGKEQSISGVNQEKYSKLVDQSSWRLDTIEDELLDHEYRKEEAVGNGRYIGFKKESIGIPSAYNLLMGLNWNAYYAANRKDDSAKEKEKLEKDFRKLLNKEVIDYAENQHMILTDYDRRIAIKTQTKELLVPPLRSYDASRSSAEIKGDAKNYAMHYSRVDLLKEGETYFDSITGRQAQYDDKTIARIFGSRGKGGVEIMFGASTCVDTSTLEDDLRLEGVDIDEIEPPTSRRGSTASEDLSLEFIDVEDGAEAGVVSSDLDLSDVGDIVSEPAASPSPTLRLGEVSLTFKDGDGFQTVYGRLSPRLPPSE